MNREQIHTLKQTMYIEVEDTDWSALMQVNDYVLIKLLLEIYSDAETSHQAKVLADCLEEIGFDKPATLTLLRHERLFSAVTAPLRMKIDNYYKIYEAHEVIKHNHQLNFYEFFRKESLHA